MVDPAVPNRTPASEAALSAVAMLLALAGLAVAYKYGTYLLFHTLAEMLALVVGFSIFLVAWNTRNRPLNGYLRFFGIGCLFIAVIDLFHTMAFKGMGIFPSVTTAEEATQLWIVGASMRAGVLVLAPLFVGRRVPVGMTVGILSVLTALGFASIFWWDNFPHCFTLERGLSDFKIYCEYVICATLGAAAILWWRVRGAFPAYVRYLIVAALLASIVSEIFFCLYKTPDGPRNFWGHMFKTVTFLLFYRAIVQTALREPFDLLMYDLSVRERELRHSEVRYRSLVEMSPRGIAVFVQNKCVFANQAFADMLGARARETVIGLDDLEIVTTEDRPVVEQRNRQLAQEGQISAVRELGLHRLDGTSITVESVASLVEWQGRQGIQTIIQDITARKRTELELQQAKAAAEAASRAKDHFLAVLSHELRTPLTPVLATVSDLLSREHVDREELREVLQLVQRNVELQTRLIDDLLDLTRIERGKFRIEKKIVDIHELVQHALACCQGEAERKNLSLRKTLRAEARWVDADPARIEQVIWNLLINAIKFTHSGGMIHVETENQAHDGREAVCIRVSDTGLGFGPDVKQRIFIAFEQADESIHKRFGGLGLGLAISRAMVLLHGGDIQADSDGPGKGSCFTVRLPVSRTAAVAEVKPFAPDAAVPPRRILLVEDHADSARVLARLLKNDGHQVQTAGDVASAVQAFEAGPFDLVISDIGLPDGSGIDLLKHIQQQRPGMPSICMSGFGAEQHVRASAEAGSLCHLVKPVSMPKLREAIQQAFSLRG